MKCLDFSLGLFIYFILSFFIYIFDANVLYNIENENELFASIDIDHPVRNSTNNTVIESEVFEEVSDQNTEPSRSINKQRFANTSTAEIYEMTSKEETKNIKDNTKWAAQVFERKM